MLVHCVWAGALSVNTDLLFFAFVVLAIGVELGLCEGLDFLQLELLVVVVGLPSLISIEILEFIIDFDKESIHLGAGIVVLFFVFRADADIQRVLTFNLIWTFLEARAFAS